jgi:hypothetical protein
MNHGISSVACSGKFPQKGSLSPPGMASISPFTIRSAKCTFVSTQAMVLDTEHAMSVSYPHSSPSAFCCSPLAWTPVLGRRLNVCIQLSMLQTRNVTELLCLLVIVTRSRLAISQYQFTKAYISYILSVSDTLSLSYANLRSGASTANLTRGSFD